jgi:hypothetical protein
MQPYDPSERASIMSSTCRLLALLQHQTKDLLDHQDYLLVGY